MNIEKHRKTIYDAIVYHMEQDDVDNDELEGNAEEATDDIIDMISEDEQKTNPITNLYDEQKYEICMRLMDKCNLETLEQIENIYSNGNLDFDKVPLPSIWVK